MPATVVAQAVDNTSNVALPNAQYTLAVPIPAGLTSALIYVQAVFDLFENFPGVPDLPIRFGGMVMNRDAEVVNDNQIPVGHLVAWLPIGDGSAFQANAQIEINFTDIVKQLPNTMRVRVQWIIADGLVQTGLLATDKLLLFNDGDTPITFPIDGGPSSFVISSCATANEADPALTVPVGFTLADTIVSGGVSSFRAHSAWRLDAAGMQDLTWELMGTVSPDLGSRTVAYAFAIAPVPPAPPKPAYNCECDTTEGARSLGDLRLEVLRETGYAAQASNPPPGIRDMYNGFINRAQEFIYSRYNSMQTERFFSWVLTPGQRFYGVLSNVDACPVRLERYKITGVWIQDLHNAWWPLRCGISPYHYTMDQSQGWPTRYEVRQCIELFPAPQDAYTLWIKGHFGLTKLVNDNDLTTIEAEAVLLHAIGMAKRHKGMPDAEDYFKMSDSHVKALVAGSHATRRYIPGHVETPVYAPPVWIK